jgi:hypothetical protein
MTKVKVIDSIMGSGKTTWAINEICSHPEKKYIYITPYLDEITRMKHSTKDYNRMVEPNIYNKTSKKGNFHKLLSEGRNVCSTHALFTKADGTTRQALNANGYTLILDEVMNVVEEVDDFTIKDLHMLFKLGLVKTEGNLLIWDEENEYDEDISFRYSDIKNMCLNKNLLVVNDKLVYWNFPVDIFQYFEEVYILTYLFKGQIQKYYYDLYEVSYDYYQVDGAKLMPYSEEVALERIKPLKELINIYEGKINSIGDSRTSLSYNWFKTDAENEDVLTPILKNNLYNWFRNISKCESDDRLWCTFKDARTKIKGDGYTKRFLPMNMRATNEFRNTKVLAYCCNRFLKPEIRSLFSSNDIIVDEDLWTLSELIQWIWRSQVREGKPIDIYIPSKRMRDILYSYLNGEIS